MTPGPTHLRARPVTDDAGRVLPLEERVKVQLVQGRLKAPCWLVPWERRPGRSRFPNYAYVSLTTGQKVPAHRWMWAAHNGPIPTGMVIHHECFEKRCVNPDHLALMTVAQNSSINNFPIRKVAA